MSLSLRRSSRISSTPITADNVVAAVATSALTVRTVSTTTTTTLLSAKKTRRAQDDNDDNDDTAVEKKATVKSPPTKRVKVEKVTTTSTTSTPKRTSKTAAATVTPSSSTSSAKKTPKKSTTRKKATTTTPKRNQKTPPPTPGSKPPPSGWEGLYSIVEELRQDKSAPLDEAGAEALPETTKGDVVFRFQVLMALMLSSQTKDAVVGEAMRRLQQHGCTLENIAHHTTPEQLNALIQKVGFHNNKTKYIKQTADILLEKYKGDIPPTAQEMIDNLPGVGPKMAYLIETIAWGTTSGIGVDTHMHRMFNQIGWVSSKNPEQTRIQLEAWLPREKWSTVNYYWVGFGQEVQQQKPKILRKALDCSRPLEALKLIKRVGVDILKEGEKHRWGDEVRLALKGGIVEE